MSLKHSEERLRTTYLELVKKNSQLEEKLLEQDSRHEEGKQKFENSIMKLTDKLIQQRKKSEELEQTNARAVRDCRWGEVVCLWGLGRGNKGDWGAFDWEWKS